MSAGDWTRHDPGPECQRCHGRMCSEYLFDWTSSGGYDGVHAFRCIACGEIVDQVILENRIKMKVRRRPRERRVPDDRFVGSGLHMR
jgi:hypothetical protein